MDILLIRNCECRRAIGHKEPMESGENGKVWQIKMKMCCEAFNAFRKHFGSSCLEESDAHKSGMAQ